jgi:hypothetical protein
MKKKKTYSTFLADALGQAEASEAPVSSQPSGNADLKAMASVLLDRDLHTSEALSHVDEQITLDDLTVIGILPCLRACLNHVL